MMSVLSYPMKKGYVVYSKAVSWLQRWLVWVPLLLIGNHLSAQVLETINENGGTSGDPGLKIEILTDGSFRVIKNGLSETYEGTADPRGIATYIGMNQFYTGDPRQVKQVTWCFVSPKSGAGTTATPWRIQLVGNVVNYAGTGRHTVICNLSYVKDQPYYILDYAIAAISDMLTTVGHLYLAERAVLGANNDWSTNSVCTKGYGMSAAPYGTAGVYRDVACGGFPTNRAHVLRINNGFTSFAATDADGMVANIPENLYLSNIANTSYDGTENGVIVHKMLGDVYGGSVISPTGSEKVYTARILAGYGNTTADFDAIPLDTFAVPAKRQLSVEFEKTTASGLEDNTRHGAYGLNIRVYNAVFNSNASTKTITLTSPLYVPITAAPSGAYPAVAGTDYECKRGIVIPAGTYDNIGTIISVDSSVMILGNTALEYSPRTVTFTLDNTCNNNLIKINTSKNTCTYQILDDEARTLTLAMPAEIDEGQTANATISLPSGVLASTDITVTLTRSATSTTAVNDLVLPASVVIKQNTNSATFTIQAQSDKILEFLETLDLQADANVLGVAQTTSGSLNIKDRTYDDPANRVISMRPVPGSTVTEPYNDSLQFYLPAGVTTDIPITITLGALDLDPASTASGADYAINSKTFTISSGNSITIPLTVYDDNLVEGTERLHVTATGTDNLSRAYDFLPQDILIIDDDSNAKLTIAATGGETETTEGGAAITFRVSLPASIVAGSDIPVTITGGGIAAAADYSAFPDITFKIPAGANSATFTINALTDNLLEGDETFYLNGTASGYTVIPDTLIIKDATWDDPANRQLQLSIIGGAVKEGNTADLKVGFVNNVLAGKPIVVTLSRNAASGASATDYALSATTITIPAGEREVTVTGFITAVTDLILEKTETLTLDGASSDIPGLTVLPATDSIVDATGDNAANKVITISPAQSTMNEGTGYNVTFSLPAGITTEVPINITTNTGAGSTAVAADYSFATIPPLDVNNAAVSATINIAADGLLETDETLVLNATSTSLPGISFVTASVTLKDQDFVNGMPITMSANNTVITEGSTTGATITLSLPAGKTAGDDIVITIAKDATSTAADGEHTVLPATVTILKGTNSVTFPQVILANTDNILEEDETLIIDMTATGFAANSLTLTIKDGGNPKVTLQPQPFSAGNIVAEGNNYTVRVALPAGITPYKPFQVTVSASSASQAATGDYTGLPFTITLNPGENYKDITLTAVTDYILEKTELLRLKGAVTGFAGVTADSLDVSIEDVTSKDPTNLQLQVVADSSILHEGNDSRVTVGFVKAAITSSENITISIAPNASFTAGTPDYSGLPATVLLPAGSNQVLQTLHMQDDNMAEGTEQLKLNTTVTAGYTITSPATITIPEATLQITATKVADAVEPASNGSFTIQLPGTLVAAADITVTLSMGGTASAADWSVTGTTAIIRAGSNSVTVPVNVTDDKLVEGDETVTLTLQQAQMNRGSSIVGFPVNTTTLTATLRDDENNAPGRYMMVEKITDAAEPAQQGAFRIRFTDPQLTVVKDVQVTYAVTGTAIAGTDYTALPGSLTIPAGQNGVTVNIAPIDEKLAEDTEIVNIRLQNVTSTMTGITWPLVGNPQADVPLLDNDTMKLDIFTQPAYVTEGETIQVTITSPSIALYDVPISLKIVHDPARTITTSEGVINTIGDTLIITLPAGATEHTFTVTTADNITNDDEGFVFLQILPDQSGAASPLYTPGLASEVNVIVAENDTLIMSFNALQYTIHEGDIPGQNTLTLEVRLSRASSRPITLPYAFTAVSGVTFMGTATPGVDFDSIMKPLVIEPGETVAYISVPILGDSTFERADTLGIKLLPPTVLSGQNVPVTAAPDSVLGIILNDDPFCATCDTDGDGIQDGKEDANGNGDPTDDDTDGDGIPNYLDLDSDSDGVPDSVEGWITDGRWNNNNDGKIRVHAAVSPNGDGVGNDAMYVENIEKYPKNEVVIFNRWGGTVFKMSGYDNKDKNFKGLNGSGKEVTDGSYFYLIYIWDENGKKEQYAGFIVIKRK